MAAAAGSTVELDFFRMEKENTAFAEAPTKIFHRKRSFRDIQGVISKINPEIVKAVITSTSANVLSVENSGVSSPKAEKKQQKIFSSPMPLYNPIYSAGTAPMTIFYNGAVVVLDDVPHQQAQNILKVAEKAVESKPDIKSNDIPVESGVAVCMPLTRKKSLRRFLEKRKGRYKNFESAFVIYEK